jgi:hypothetical protein
MHSSNYLLANESNRQYYRSHYHCIIRGALVRLEVRGKQVFFLFFRDLLFIIILI